LSLDFYLDLAWLPFIVTALLIRASIKGERAADIDNDGTIWFTDVSEMIEMIEAGCP
jgi:hypothetical protein